MDRFGDPLPAATLDLIRRYRVALKGPCTTPVGKGFRSINVRLRKELDLYASIRPVQWKNRSIGDRTHEAASVLRRRAMAPGRPRTFMIRPMVS